MARSKSSPGRHIRAGASVGRSPTWDTSMQGTASGTIPAKQVTVTQWHDSVTVNLNTAWATVIVTVTVRA